MKTIVASRTIDIPKDGAYHGMMYLMVHCTVQFVGLF